MIDLVEGGGVNSPLFFILDKRTDMYRLNLEFANYGTEPITLQEAKDHLRISNTAEDTLITGLISAAREWAENYTNRSFIEKEVTVWITQTAGESEFDLTHGPIATMDAVYGVDKDGTETALTLNGDYYLYGGSQKTIEFVSSLANSNYKIQYTTQDDCPEGAKQAILKIVAEMWENRAISTDGGQNANKALEEYNARVMLNAYKQRIWI